MRGLLSQWHIVTSDRSVFVRQWAPCIAMLLLSLLSYADRSVLAILSPTILADLHLTATQYGYAVSVFSVCYMVSNPVWGVLDRPARVVGDDSGCGDGLVGCFGWSCVDGWAGRDVPGAWSAGVRRRRDVSGRAGDGGRDAAGPSGVRLGWGWLIAEVRWVRRWLRC